MESKNLIGLNTSVDEDVIKRAVNDTIKTAIYAAMGEPEKLIKKVVDEMVNMWVDGEGREARKGSWKARPYIEYITEKTVKDSIRECIKELVEENKESFKAAVKKYLMQGEFRNKMAETYIEAVLGTAKNEWTMPIEINFKERKRD